MSDFIFDIETGPVPEEELRSLYTVPTWEEFNVSCDQRWKEETRRAKFVEHQKADWEKYASRAALSPITGRVLAIGILGGKAMDGVTFGAIDGDDEESMLQEFWNIAKSIRAANCRLIGWNSNGFDVPFLVRRSWKQGVYVPDWIIENSRFISKTFFDLMLHFAAGTRDAFTKLDTAARWFGVGGKPDGISGADFARLAGGSEADHEAAREYLLNDLRMTAAVACRMGEFDMP